MFAYNTDLRFITSERTDGNHSAKVFCGFHPVNHRIADEIMQDMISVCDCTVFYYEKGTALYSDWKIENDLSQMSLFVFVVSSDYLSSGSFARDVLYSYAVAHRIPILPIVTEPGLEVSFNSVFGNLQYILWHGEIYDITSIPYQERLKNHLNQVFCMDKSKSEFRDVFDTSVFLSYRKKDRYYAQKLMEMIHADERCHSISIWYDEFLIPGEDFNQNIQQELENSSLMLLVVTPHITEKNNYIIQTEYPTALRMEKTVLPFEMCPTSRSELEGAYAGLPTVVSTEEADSVHQAVLTAAQKLGIKFMETTAEKEYLRGLAYLKGICVEKNKEIGSKKIMEAAKSGVPQAMQILAAMYKNGEGLARSIEEAALWQGKYIETVWQQYTADNSAENAQCLIESYFELGSIYEQDLKHQPAIEAYKKIQQLCENAQFANVPAFVDLSVAAKIKAGTLYMALGDYVSARYHCFERAADKRKKQLEQEYNIQQALSLCQLYALTSACCEKCQDRAGAKTYAILLRDELDSIADLKTSEENYFSLLNRLALCKSQLAHLYIKHFEDKSHQAFICVGEAIEIAEKLVRLSDCYASKRQLVLAHMNDGDQHIKQNQQNHFRAAEAAYARAYNYLTEMRDTYGFGFELQQISARIMQKQGFVKHGLGESQMAQRLYEDALEAFRHLKRSQDTPVTRKDLYDCMKDLGVTYQLQGKNSEVVEKLFLEAAELAQKNVQADPLAVYKKDAATIHGLLAEIYKSQWDMDSAFARAQMQVNLLRQVMEGTGRVGDLRLFVSALLSALRIAKLAGEFETGNAWQQELQDLHQQYEIYLK